MFALQSAAANFPPRKGYRFILFPPLKHQRLLVPWDKSGVLEISSARKRNLLRFALPNGKTGDGCRGEWLGRAKGAERQPREESYDGSVDTRLAEKLSASK